MSTITTYQRHLIDPTAPDEALIDPIDMAHALSLLCRAGGHFSHFYSVAQHSLNCAKEAKCRGYSDKVVLCCLLHDASEAYLSDITRPVKARLPDYLTIEETLQNAIYRKFLHALPDEDELALIKAVDDTLLHYEFLSIMNETVYTPAPTLHAELTFSFIPFEQVEKEFLKTLEAQLQTMERNKL